MNILHSSNGTPTPSHLLVCSNNNWTTNCSFWRKNNWLNISEVWSMFKIEALIWVSYWSAYKSQPFRWRAGSNSRHQTKNIEMKCRTHIKLVHELYGTCFTTMWRIKNQPSNSIACSDNALCLLVLVAGKLHRRLQVCLHFQFGVMLWERYILKGIEDFNHWVWFS